LLTVSFSKSHVQVLCSFEGWADYELSYIVLVRIVVEHRMRREMTMVS